MEKKGRIVELGNLEDNKKMEFFNFLMQNNIAFQKGKQNYVAKVTIKADPLLKKKTFLQQRSSYNNQTNKSQMKNEVLKPSKRKEVKTPKKKNESTLSKNKSTPAPDALSSNRSHKTKSERSFTQKSSKQNRKPYKKSASNIQTTHFSPNITQNKNKSEENEKKIDVEKKKLNSELKKKINDQKEISDLVNKYLKVFNLKLHGQRPIKWSISQLLKTIEEIYDECFSKNTQILQNKNMIPKKNISNIFVKSIKDYFYLKFKSEKLANSNLINMLHSLSIYLERQKNLHHPISQVNKYKTDRPQIWLQMFEDFISQVYEEEDLLFFLFARSMMRKELRLQNKIKQNEEEEIILNLRQIPKLLVCIVGKDADLIQEYKNIIISQMEGSNLTFHEILRILVEDYRIKRLLCQQPSLQDKPLFKDPTQRKFENSINELTFGEDAQSNKEYQSNDLFWECAHIELDNFSDQIELIVAEKLQKKVKQFVGIIISNEIHSEYNSMQTDADYQQLKKQSIEKLLLRKSLNLLHTITKMNKIKWFQELGIKDPNQNEIQFVEKLQLTFRNLKRSPNAKGIGQFCKSILTVSKLTSALQKLLF